MTKVFLEALTNISLRKVEGVQDTILGYSKISTLTTKQDVLPTSMTKSTMYSLQNYFGSS